MKELEMKLTALKEHVEEKNLTIMSSIIILLEIILNVYLVMPLKSLPNIKNSQLIA